MGPLFNMNKQKSGEQPKALAMAVLAAAQNIDNLQAILPVVDRIAIRHCDCNVKEEHYPIVGDTLIRSY